MNLRVPQIDLAAILAEQNPQIDLRVQSYETSTRNFLKAVTNYKTRTIATISDKRTNHAAEKKKTTERIAAVEAETNHCKVQEIQLVTDMQREQEERKDAELGVAAFKRQLNALRDKCAAIDAEIEHYRAIAANLNREKEKERTTLSSLATRLSPELESLEHRICCVVEGVDESQLLFRLSRVDPTDPTRELTFVLDLSTSSYKVLTISAPLPTLPRLLAQLEESGDIYTFVRDVRKAYADTTS